MGTCDILVGGNPAMETHLVQGGGGGGEAILLGMLHAKETGISFDRLGLWLVWAFILTYFISCYMLLISTVIKTNARHYVRCSILVHCNYFCPFFVILCHQIEQRNELI